MNYTLALTSCNRHDLLEQSLTSFFDCADIFPREIVIVEDGDTPAPDFLKKYRHLNIRWINNGARRGQVFTILRLIDEVKTDRVVISEDDWLFTTGDFVRKSFDILDKHSEIRQVSLRGNDCNGHPLVKDPRFPFCILEPGWRGGWGGASMNPTAMRTSDLRSFIPVLRPFLNQHGLSFELTLSKHNLDQGFRIATLGTEPHITHLGAGRSRAIEPIEYKAPKVLIAIKAGHALQYSRWESGDSPKYDKANESYGDGIHISTDVNPRLQAIRDTWWKDTDLQNLTAKFFYGRPPDNRQAKADEVFLPVDDDYGHLVDKSNAIIRWAYENGFDFVFLCDDDTAVYIDRLLDEINIGFDYAGYLNGKSCSGGPGYFLSRKAMAEVARNPITSHWAEDVAVSMCMSYAGIEPVMLPNHRPGFSAHYFFNEGFDPNKLGSDIVSMHALTPEHLREWYAHKDQA